MPMSYPRTIKQSKMRTKGKMHLADYGEIDYHGRKFTVSRGIADSLSVDEITSHGTKNVFFSQGEDTQQIDSDSGGKRTKYGQDHATDRQVVTYLESAGAFQI